MNDLCTIRFSVRHIDDNTGLFFVQALAAGRAWIQIKERYRVRRALNSQNVTVAANEQVGTSLPHLITDPGRPATGVPPNVRHPHAYTSECCFQMLAGHASNHCSVNVSIDGHGRCERLKLIEDLHAAKISSVQNAVDTAERVGNRWMEVSVRVGNDADSQRAGGREIHRTATIGASV